MLHDDQQFSDSRQFILFQGLELRPSLPRTVFHPRRRSETSFETILGETIEREREREILSLET